MSVSAYRLAKSKVHSEAIRSGEAGDFVVLRIDDLKVDHAYQRDLDVNLVQKIARSFDIAAAGPIVVSLRSDGSYFIVNGQHRAAGAKTAGEEEIIAQVVDYSGVPLDEARRKEAELRLKGNDRRSDKALERFRAQIAASHRESLHIVEICDQFGTRINPWADPRHGVTAISTVERLYRKDNGGHLVQVFKFIQEAYGRVDGPSAASTILSGVSWLLERHDNEMNRGRMAQRLGIEGLDSLNRQARAHKAAMGGSLWMNTYRAMIGIYNERLKEDRRLAWRTSTPAKEARDSMDRAAEIRASQGFLGEED
jgi:hypothetical protein